MYVYIFFLYIPFFFSVVELNEKGQKVYVLIILASRRTDPFITTTYSLSLETNFKRFYICI